MGAGGDLALKLPEQYSIEVKNARRILTHHTPVYAPSSQRLYDKDAEHWIKEPEPVSTSRAVASYDAAQASKALPAIQKIAELDERVHSGIEEGERRLCLKRMARLMGEARSGAVL